MEPQLSTRTSTKATTIDQRAAKSQKNKANSIRSRKIGKASPRKAGVTNLAGEIHTEAALPIYIRHRSSVASFSVTSSTLEVMLKGVSLFFLMYFLLP
ncbi:hypothetical protein [Porphyromonas macacae]|uniref:hypothetical protein n=1 Tax=Porphyromonas macacae TaxID=28115 RepID=UPI00138B1019|nr:hypothetical protein [Porphyromonas macacae]